MSAAVVPSPQTLRRIDQGEQFLRWIIPRRGETDDEKETGLVMLFAHMEERYAQGIHDAADVLAELAAARPQSRELGIAARALQELERRARAEPTKQISSPALSHEEAGR